MKLINKAVIFTLATVSALAIPITLNALSGRGGKEEWSGTGQDRALKPLLGLGLNRQEIKNLLEHLKTL